MRPLPYEIMPEPPARVDAATVLARLVDAIGFRYRWVSEDLRERDWRFRAHPEAMDLRALSVHILHLLRRCAREFGVLLPDRVPVGDRALRAAVLEAAWATRERLLRRESATVIAERWALIHGPLADALTHIGQLAVWRRQAGNPMPPMSWSRGRRRDG